MSGDAARGWDAPLPAAIPDPGTMDRGAPGFGRRLLADPGSVAALAVLAAIVGLAVLAPVIAPADPLVQDLRQRLAPPSAAYWLGTDALGRETWSRLLWGARPTLGIVALVAVIVGPLGLAIGIASGFAGGWADRVLTRLTDIVMAFPQLLLALAFAAALGPGIGNAVVAIAITSWAPYARIARTETMLVRDSDFVSAIRMQGASTLRVLAGHVLPLCLSSVLVRLTLDMAGIILVAASLGFLGLGAQPPQPEWGAMVAEGRDFLMDQWWICTLPGIAIFLASLAFNLLGDGLRDALDPRGRDR